MGRFNDSFMTGRCRRAANPFKIQLHNQRFPFAVLHRDTDMPRQPLYLTTAVNGGLGGLVAITAGCATMTAPFAILSGLLGGVIAALGSRLLLRFRLDDVVDAVSVHAFCGVWGTVAAGLFFTGDLFNPERIIVQLIGVVAAFAWSFPVALLSFKLIDRIWGLRVNAIHERRGLDISEHYETGYPEFQTDLSNRGFESLPESQPQRATTIA